LLSFLDLLIVSLFDKSNTDTNYKQDGRAVLFAVAELLVKKFANPAYDDTERRSHMSKRSSSSSGGKDCWFACHHIYIFFAQVQ